jgi:hypothetical protein
MVQLVPHYEKNIWLQRKTPFYLRGNQINISLVNQEDLIYCLFAMCLIVLVEKKADLCGS